MASTNDSGPRYLQSRFAERWAEGYVKLGLDNASVHEVPGDYSKTACAGPRVSDDRIGVNVERVCVCVDSLAVDERGEAQQGIHGEMVMRYAKQRDKSSVRMNQWTLK